MGRSKDAILATIGTDWQIPKQLYRGDSPQVVEELNRFHLRHAGSWLRNGVLSFEMKAHPNLVLELQDPNQDLLSALAGHFEPSVNQSVGRFLGDPTSPLSPIEIGEALSSQPLGRLELRFISKGGERFEDVRQSQTEALQTWLASYSKAQGVSPTQRPALEARAWAASVGNSRNPGSVRPDQLKDLFGARIYQILKDSKRITF